MVFTPRIKRVLSSLFVVALLAGTGATDVNSAWARSRHVAPQAETLSIQSVKLNSDGSSLVLEANRPFTGHETRNLSVLKLPSPYRLLVDIPNATLDVGQKVFQINQNGIERVEMTSTQSPFYSSVRAVIYVSDSQTLARLNTAFEGKTLVLAGMPPMAIPPNQMASTEFVKPAKVKVGTAKPLPPVAAPLPGMTIAKATAAPLPDADEKQVAADPSAQNVLGVPLKPGTDLIEQVYFRDNKLFIKGRAGADLRVKNRFLLTAPNRLVMDIDNAVLSSKELTNPITTASEEIHQIRVGQFDENTVRIVIEGLAPEQFDTVYFAGERNLLAVVPYGGSSITKLSANTKLGEVQSIDLKREGGNTVLRLTASTPIVHRFLKKDDQVTLDLLNEASHPTAIGFDARQYPEIEKMRLQPLSEGQPNSKLAITLVNSGVNVTPKVSEDGKVMELVIAGNVAGGAFANLNSLGAAGKAPFPARIVVDAGHGGKDIGANRQGVYEKDLNLSLALMLKDALEAKGFKVYMTRDTDVFLPLPKITAITNQIHPDLFISIHHNASVNTGIHGIETYYYTPQSVALARKVQTREINAVGARDGGVKKAMFYVIHHTNVPAILCEVGYVSNPSELDDLQSMDRKSKTARAIADGVVDYVKASISAKAR